LKIQRSSRHTAFVNVLLFIQKIDMATNDTKPSGLPVPNSTVPFWRTQLHEIDEHRSTEDIPSECDVLIIGAGYCGASTAYHLINDNPSPPSIVILEARQACSGATARNGKITYAYLKRLEQNLIIVRRSSPARSNLAVCA
jgi:hypothetical protein